MNAPFTPFDPARFDRPIRQGEYDLANISLLGFDPRTGASFEKVEAAWRAKLDRLEADIAGSHWWQFRRRREMGRRGWALRTHLGMQ